MNTIGNHVARVRALYKAILKLHRSLAPELRSIGDQYVRSEFRSHRVASPEQVTVFMEEWAKYYVTLASDVRAKKHPGHVGHTISPSLLQCFSGEQTVQLYELFREAIKPQDKKSGPI